MNPPHAPHILLVNPWIHDFAAYDFWAKPLGLLTLGGILRRARAARSPTSIAWTGFIPLRTRRLIACALRARSLLKTGYRQTRRVWMTSPRNYCRYGITPDWFRATWQRWIPPIWSWSPP